MMQYEKLLDGESQERIFYLARIGLIFERLYGIKDLHDAVYRASTGAGFAARRLAEFGYTDEKVEELLRERLFFYRANKMGQ
ncbi:hypothetical protein SAMN04487970_102710 [Paenibacillus tianmuensis]|uniref:Uncharacterized protein n=1 Tax=Paenibacillus tianmuensis TaxID=624147 RepID=A0A1G4SDV6_9BACL|nr:hypothetical protein [Paenibacillus tianmuensis]SCW67383.1 hypothetical protein SAMN04487970_102710 [Paenibacillus tianmuensis]